MEEEIVMNNPTLEISRPQLISALSQFPPTVLKKLIDELFKKQLYIPRPLDEITREASSVVRLAELGPETAGETVKWVRSQK
jgi:hypothetical protein